jgi:hypothetical protein
MEINKLITEELEKFKLFSKYSPEKTLTENEIVLMEQTKTIPQQAYELMVKGFGGPGTNPNYIKDGINMLKSADDFYAMNDLFKKGGTGYNSFDDAIRKEFEFGKIKDFSNQDDLNKIADKLKKLTVQFNYGKNSESKDFTVLPKPEPVGDAETPEVETLDTGTPDAGTLEVKTPVANTEILTKPKFIPEKFPLQPLQYMMQGNNVKKLQQALDVRNKAGKPNITGKFFDATQAALDKKAKELGLSYDRNKGLTKDDFDKIIAAREKFSSGGATDFDTAETLQQRNQQQVGQTNNIEKRPDDMPGELKNIENDVKDDDVNNTGY